MDERDRAAHVTEPLFVAETLAWCNEKRAENHKRPLKKLPRGERDNGNSCPCGKATDLYVGSGRYGSTVSEAVSKRGGKLPRPVSDFVFAFDRGDLPQYDLLAPRSGAPAGASSPPGTAPESAGNSPGAPVEGSA